jgi:hypothetical protein
MEYYVLNGAIVLITAYIVVRLVLAYYFPRDSK